jgi:hypothetical protein
MGSDSDLHRTQLRAPLLLLQLNARRKDLEFTNVTRRWDIDWFWMDDRSHSKHDLLSKQKEFYALNLVNASTEQQLWSYS